MDFAVAGLHDALRDRKAEAITALRTGAGAVHPVKPLKDMGDLIRGNLIAGITHCSSTAFSCNFCSRSVTAPPSPEYFMALSSRMAVMRAQPLLIA